MWLTIISFILRLIGFAETADKFLKNREIKKQAQETADAPVTNKEEADYWDK